MSAVSRTWRTDADEITLMEAEQALKWAAGGEFSARVTPLQANMLLQELDWLRSHAAPTYTREGGYTGMNGMSGIGAPPDFGRSSA